MAPTKTSPPNVPKKKRSSGGLRRKKPSPYNKFISVELQRLKDVGIGEDHKERMALAIKRWHQTKDVASSP
ncbi:hypothetical protein C8R47DRAFT_1129025 [Mycena vitilis]|nr:hypothetical protein C8R47DRAFT_1129025 [Mycena vitilis]